MQNVKCQIMKKNALKKLLFLLAVNTNYEYIGACSYCDQVERICKMYRCIRMRNLIENCNIDLHDKIISSNNFLKYSKFAISKFDDGIETSRVESTLQPDDHSRVRY